MTEEQARQQLRRMLRSFTAGSVLHLLGEVHQKLAEKARRRGDDSTFERLKAVEWTLFVVGLGVDAARPQ